jgi:hypothetical protein
MQEWRGGGSRGNAIADHKDDDHEDDDRASL